MFTTSQYKHVDNDDNDDNDDDNCDVCYRLSPLHVSVLQDNVELTGLLLQHGAQVDTADKRGLLNVVYSDG